MATRIVELEGPVKWARLFEENRDMHEFHKDYGGAYKVLIGIDDDQLQKLKDAGWGGREKSEEGSELNWVNLKRKHQDRFEWASGQPKVTNAAGIDWDFENDGEVGNDSECKVKVSVYDTSYRINGTRLEEVVVLKHVPWEEASKATGTDGVPF